MSRECGRELRGVASYGNLLSDVALDIVLILTGAVPPGRGSEVGRETVVLIRGSDCGRRPERVLVSLDSPTVSEDSLVEVDSSAAALGEPPFLVVDGGHLTVVGSIEHIGSGDLYSSAQLGRGDGRCISRGCSRHLSRHSTVPEV